ncbi:hypothetical protein SDD30_10155 [Moorella naiadis]|uniref:hypothetical protein n=1 Tax=Moorella naiadis (nom. illeg.) TaxID=3093670 RepID=UPI003D9C8EAC
MEVRAKKLSFPEMGILGGDKEARQEKGDPEQEKTPALPAAGGLDNTKEEPQDSPPRQDEPVTLAARSQALFQEALLNGNIDQFLSLLQSWIEKLRNFLNYTEVGVTTANNILTVTKTTLQADLGVQPAAASGTPAGMALPASSLQLMWNLIRTPEFQTFAGRMLAQALKMNLSPPVQPLQKESSS